MEKVNRNIIVPSASFTVDKKQIKYYSNEKFIPEIGDVVLGEIASIGQHKSLENKEGRIHKIYRGTKAVFVFGNRYAPDYYEGHIPTEFVEEVDLLARSGLIGIVKTKSAKVIGPTKVKIIGFVCDKEGNRINTKNFPIVKPKKDVKKKKRAKLILVCGTSMNSGKSQAAAACCWSLKSLGYNVRGTKVTGTASLKDILLMNDSGAEKYSDFTYLGYPSTYLIPEKEMIDIFNKLDLKYANNPNNFWVVEFADGINQKETRMLLKSEEVRSRIHKFIFCAADAFGTIGGLKVLKEEFNLIPNAVSGVCSSSPLHVEELKEFTEIPVFNSMNPDLEKMKKILL